MIGEPILTVILLFKYGYEKMFSDVKRMFPGEEESIVIGFYVSIVIAFGEFWSKSLFDSLLYLLIEKKKNNNNVFCSVLCLLEVLVVWSYYKLKMEKGSLNQHQILTQTRLQNPQAHADLSV